MKIELPVARSALGVYTVSLAKAEMDRLARLSEGLGCTRSALIRLLLQQATASLEEQLKGQAAAPQTRSGVVRKMGTGRRK